MNKSKIDQMIYQAYVKLCNEKDKSCEEKEKACIFSSDGKLPKQCQSRLSAFGASISTGSLWAGLSNYVDVSDRNDAKNAYGKEILDIIWELMKEQNSELEGESLLTYIMNLEKEGNKENLYKCKREIKDAAVAVKLAMNFFEIEKGGV